MEASTLRRAVCAFSRPSAHPSRSSRRALTLPQRRSAFLGLPHPFLSAFLLLTSLRITWALAAQAQAGSQEQFRLIDEILLGGEAINFAEVLLDEFRVPAGVQGWTEFISSTSISMLR